MPEYKKVETKEVEGDIELGPNNVDLPVAIAEPESKSEPVKKQRVRIVAPCRLPPLYHLIVQTSDGTDDNTVMTFDVVIPNPGVHKGQEFEAEFTTPPSSITGEFSSDLCSCCDDPTCITGWFCPGFVFAAVQERMGLDWRARPGPNKYTYAVVSAVYLVFLGLYILNIVSGGQVALVHVPFIFLIVVQTRTRMAVREKYRIPGDCFLDCCTIYWCGLCSSVQMHRHMRESGDRPRVPFRMVAEGKLVV